jgi:hypothetical protein
MDEHLAAIRAELEEMLQKRDLLPRPDRAAFATSDEHDAALLDYLSPSAKLARRDKALGEKLRGAFRALEDLTSFFADPAALDFPQSDATDSAPDAADPPVVQPEGVRLPPEP